MPKKRKGTKKKSSLGGGLMEKMAKIGVESSPMKAGKKKGSISPLVKKSIL